MFLKKATNSKTGRTYLSIVHGYWDSVAKQSRTKPVQKIGYLDELLKEYDDPIAHFEKIAAEMNEERKETKNATITINFDEQLNRNETNRKNYGHVIFSKIYHELEIDRFLKNARRYEGFKFNTDAIMRLLVFSRLLFPASKRATVINKDLFFDNFNFTLDDTYGALSHYHLIADPLQRHLHEQVTKKYQRETDLVYYDVTNYYFEIDKQDELRKIGASKKKTKDPIVQMGLMMDKYGLPIFYRIFPGNKHDSQTLMPMQTEIKKTFDVGRIIIVADKGLNSGDNIAYNTILHDGYIFSKSVRGASADFKKWVLDDTGYKTISDDYKLKSKIVPDAPVKVTVSEQDGKKSKKTVKLEQKWVACYSKKYAERSIHKREEAVAKAQEMIANPMKFKRTYDYGAAGYISNLKIDKETGEILNVKDALILDTAKIEDEKKYDGYYAIVTSELDDSDEHILATYRGLWKIEDSFKVTKSVLGTRPIHLRTFEHINAHFLTCFISLLIGRIVEMKLEGKYTIAKITDTLRKVACTHIDQNLWLFDFADEVTDAMNKVFKTNFGKKIMTLQEIKKNLGAAKKR
jgi:transposase